MPKLTAPFKGCPDGAVYPVDFAAGDECPAELVSAATAAGAIKAAKPKRAAKPDPEGVKPEGDAAQADEGKIQNEEGDEDNGLDDGLDGEGEGPDFLHALV